MRSQRPARKLHPLIFFALASHHEVAVKPEVLKSLDLDSLKTIARRPFEERQRAES
jgi:hypothetical protein